MTNNPKSQQDLQKQFIIFGSGAILSAIISIILVADFFEHLPFWTKPFIMIGLISIICFVGYFIVFRYREHTIKNKILPNGFIVDDVITYSIEELIILRKYTYNKDDNRFFDLEHQSEYSIRCTQDSLSNITIVYQKSEKEKDCDIENPFENIKIFTEDSKIRLVCVTGKNSHTINVNILTPLNKGQRLSFVIKIIHIKNRYNNFDDCSEFCTSNSMNIVDFQHIEYRTLGKLGTKKLSIVMYFPENYPVSRDFSVFYENDKRAVITKELKRVKNYNRRNNHNGKQNKLELNIENPIVNLNYLLSCPLPKQKI